MNAPNPTTVEWAAVAAHRFGLGEASLQRVGSDPRGWLRAQIGPAETQRGADLPGTAEAVRTQAEVVSERRAQRERLATAVAPDAMSSTTGPSAVAVRREQADHLRQAVQADLRARLTTAALSTAPFNERLALFWSNHFTVSMAKASVRGLVGAFEREAIRPHIAGSFQTLLKAAVTHPAMLRYLDNQASAGPDSPIVQRLARRAARLPADDPMQRRPRVSGLNENLAREVLELHTLGAAEHAYNQADVTAFAAVLTGWRYEPGSDRGTVFDPAWHEPGPKRLLGRSYPEGPEALDEVLHDLSRHPATARFIAIKLARHIVADDPPPALVARLADRFSRTDGDLAAVYGELIDAPEAWALPPQKLKTPEEFVISAMRLLQIDEAGAKRLLARAPDGGSGQLGQRVQAAASPAGWPDRAEEWLGPD
ncbi:MAG: DUF1800 domain-containing protein, partial [Pseudomonadota bacterium]|nr:DUF1800 domain-containing protein [Pseudomonadota bacterium]